MPFQIKKYFKNLGNKNVFKAITIVLFITTCFSNISFVPLNIVKAQDTLNSKLNIEYLLDKGLVRAKYNITINSDSNYPTVLNYYTIPIPAKDLKNVSVSSGTEVFQFDIKNKNSTTEVSADFKNKVIKSSAPFTFTLSFEIPKQNSNEQLNSFTYSLPGNFIKDLKLDSVKIKFDTKEGKPQYSNVVYNKIDFENGFTNIEYYNLNENLIEIIIGNDISYKFIIDKNLQNLLNEEVNVEVPLPRAQHNQSLLISKISEKPNITYRDENGNIFLAYKLAPEDKLNIKIEGIIIISPNESEAKLDFQQKRNSSYIDNVWAINDQGEIAKFELFNKLNEVNIENGKLNEKDISKFIENSYNYTIETLTPSSSSIISARTGIDYLLKNKNSASPEDYADFLTALLRKYGIPTRTVIGFVIPVNKNEKPYQHTWIEYFTDNTGWKSLDPSLDDLSPNNFYGKNYIDHISILTREKNPYSPRFTLSPNTEINFYHNNDSIESKTSAEVKYLQNEDNFELQITNTGNTILNEYELNSEAFRFSDLHNYNQLLLPNETTKIKIVLNEDININRNIDSSLIIKDLNNSSYRTVFSASIIDQNLEENKILIYLISAFLVINGIAIIWFIFNKFSIIRNANKKGY